MTQHIIDTDKLVKLKQFNTNGTAFVYFEDLRALIASSPQADDVRKDAERFEWVITEGSQDIEGIITRNDYKNVREAIDKARE